jgi:alpha-amylase
MAGDNLYKSPEIVAVNHFRNAMIGEKQNTFNPNDNVKVVCIERGTKGLVIVNSSKDAFTFSTDTALANGTYKDRVSGNEYTVKTVISKER